MKQYMKQHNILGYTINIPCTLFFIFTTNLVLATDDDYLNELSAEAEASAHVSSSVDNAGPSEQQFALENLLKKEKPTTFKYYTKLNHKDKAAVVELYHTDNTDAPVKFDLLRKKILDLYFKR